MTRLTVLEIITNRENIKCSASGPDRQEKYSGWIELWKDGTFHKICISTDSIFTSESSAIGFMENIVKELCRIGVAGITKGIGG